MRTCKILYNVIENFDFSTLPSPEDVTPQQICKGNTYFDQGILEHVKRRPLHALNYYLSGARLGHGDCMFGIYVLTHDCLDEDETWLYQAARYGCIGALFNCGYDYEINGYDHEACCWYIRAYFAGESRALKGVWDLRELCHPTKYDSTRLSDIYREFIDKECLPYSSNYFSEYSDSIYPTLDLLSGDKDRDFYGINQYINSGEMPLTQEAINFIMSSAYIPYIRDPHYIDLGEDDSNED